MACKGLRTRTQVPATPENDCLSRSSLTVHATIQPSPTPPSCSPPPPSQSRPPTTPPPQTPPPQNRKAANPIPDHAPTNSPPFSTTHGLTNAQKIRLFEIELEKGEHQTRQAAAAQLPIKQKDCNKLPKRKSCRRESVA